MLRDVTREKIDRPLGKTDILLIMDLGFFSARLRMLQLAQRDFMFAPLFPRLES
jgi:hypothetical protein